MEEQLALSAEREAALARELGRCKAECSELQSKLTNAVESASKAKKAARDALIDMAEQNAKLVAAYVEKKREVKQLQAAAKEDRKVWQQRLQKMEHELQANKLHITALMQQLHALAAKQLKNEQSPAAPTPCSAASPSCVCSAACNGSRCSAQLDGSNSRGSQSPDEVTSKAVPINNTGRSPFKDATNTFSTATRSAGHDDNNSSSQQQCHNDTQSNSCPFEHVALRQPASSAKTAASARHEQGDQAPQRDQEQQHKVVIDQWLQNLQSPRLRNVHQHSEARKQQQQRQQQQEQQQQPMGSVGFNQPQHPVYPQQQVTQQAAAQQEQAVVQEQQQHNRDQELQELQQRAQQLEAENAALRQAQAEADALRSRVQRMQEAEQLKQSGNRYYQSHQYKKAHQSYSDALALNVEDSTFNAVLLCNRAAALHSLGQYLDAIADCCMAAQLDKSYPRVLQRRAEAYMAIDDYSSAVADLQQLVELSSSKEASHKLKDAQQKLRVQGSAGPNYYLVLGLQQSCSNAEVKAAYKKLALRYHPDKVTGGSHAKAASEAVFVLITAANSVLADPVKRAAYDTNQQAVRIRRSMSSNSNGIGSYRHVGRDSSSSSGGGMYNWHHSHGTSAFRGSYAGSAAAAAEKWRAAASQHSRHPSNSGHSRNTEGSNSSASSGAAYNAFN